MLQTEVFEANEYIAACYTGVCDISGEVFLDSNGNGVYDRGIDSRSTITRRADSSIPSPGRIP